MIQLNTQGTETGGKMEEEQLDSVISDLKQAVGPVIDIIEADDNSPRAALVIGAAEIVENGEVKAIQTIIDVCGDYELLGEALVNELLAGIGDNNPQLFNLLREVVRAVEQELDIDSEQPFEQEERTLH